MVYESRVILALFADLPHVVVTRRDNTGVSKHVTASRERIAATLACCKQALTSLQLTSCNKVNEYTSQSTP